MPKNECILRACSINGDGSGHKLVGDEASKMLKDDALAWVHLDANHEGTRQWLQENVSYLDHIILDALLAEETRPRMMEVGEGTLLILRAVNLNPESDPSDMLSLRMWVDGNRIITLRRRQIKTVEDVYERFIAGNGPKNSGEFIAQVTSRLFERMEPIMSDLDERVDNIEERILDHPDASERQEIVEIRKRAILFRRHIAPQKDVMTHLRLSEQPWMETAHKRKLQEGLDRVTRFIEDLDAIRERAQIVKDELANALSDKLNKNLYILSIISAIFLPLGFFTGLMGINIGGMPGVENGNAFWIFTGILIVLVAIQMFIFKKLKWF